jgi:hypothetical protein
MSDEKKALIPEDRPRYGSGGRELARDEKARDWKEHGPRWHESVARHTVQCRVAGCDEPVTRIRRHKVTVEWEITNPLNGWDLGAFDDGTHFHLFCEAGHETKAWGRDLPKRLQKVVYPKANQ